MKVVFQPSERNRKPCSRLIRILWDPSVGPSICGSRPPFFQREQTCVLEMFPTKVSTFQAGFSLGFKSEKTDTAEEKKKTTKNKNQPLDSRLEICKIHRLQSMCHSVPTACSSFTTGYFDKPISAPRSKLVPLKKTKSIQEDALS